MKELFFSEAELLQHQNTVDLPELPDTVAVEQVFVLEDGGLLLHTDGLEIYVVPEISALNNAETAGEALTQGWEFWEIWDRK